MKSVSIIGIGKLGLCFALNLEKEGYLITGVDKNEDYVELVNTKKLKSDEDGVEDMLTMSENFIATTDLSRAIENKLIFLLVATPSLPDGTYDHSQVDSVADQLIVLGKQEEVKYLVVGCTTMPGYCKALNEKLKPYNYEVSYNPEFIAQGTIIEDQKKPDMVLIGQSSTEAGDYIASVYNDLIITDAKYCRMTPTEAEITKIALNCFLTTKIAYANMVGDVAMASDCSPDTILEAIGQDSRIGEKYLGYGFGFGGPCFPRDNVAFGNYAKTVGVNPYISEATDKSNNHHLEQQVEQHKLAGNRTVEFVTVTYKPQSTMLVESQQLKLAVRLADDGFTVIIKERESVINELKKLYGTKFIYEQISSS